MLKLYRNSFTIHKRINKPEILRVQAFNKKNTFLNPPLHLHLEQNINTYHPSTPTQFTLPQFTHNKCKSFFSKKQLLVTSIKNQKNMLVTNGFCVVFSFPQNT